jgi:hypothetical protein
MTRRQFSLGILAGLVFAGSCFGTTGAARAASSGGSAAAGFNATGVYCVQATGNAFTQGLIHLTQQNDTIVGRYGHGGQLSAMLSGTVATAKWKDQRGAGWATLVFTPAGRNFDGEWGYNGRKAEGKIVATRIDKSTTNANACQ